MSDLMKIGELILGRYEVVDLLPGGGQAAVAKAKDRQSGQLVVVRRLMVEPDQPHFQEELARFQRQASIRIGHPNVVDPIDVGEDDGAWCMVTPFIDGVDLQVYLTKAKGKLSPDRAVSILVRIADALAAIHRKGVVHRDIKPANILIDQAGQPHIIDLGICRVCHEATITQGEKLMGTLEWMAPEQGVRPGSEDHRTDLHALGMVMYLMLTGAMPYSGRRPEDTLLAICRNVPTPPRQLDPSIPPHLETLCLRLLEKEPDARPQNAQEVITVLQNGPAVSAKAGTYCKSCGSSIHDSSRFCTRCGTPTGEAVTSIHCLACGIAVNGESICPGCIRSFGTHDHRLGFTSGPLTGRQYRAPEGMYVVGRDQLMPRDAHISRRHLLVCCTNGSVQLQDAGSVNKTYIGGALADRPVTLSSNIEIVIAGSKGTYTRH